MFFRLIRLFRVRHRLLYILLKLKLLNTKNILFLGTGTSTGVPQIACQCEVCRSENPKDKRLRASVLISDEKTSVLIDCGPDFRQQMLKHDIRSFSAILLTHEHYDHVGGLDDIRPFGDVDIYAEKCVTKAVHRTMPYCFCENRHPGVPKISMHEITENEEFEIGTFHVETIRVMHANLPILGFRINNIAYLTDVKTIDDKALEQLKGLDVLILSALRNEEHLSHLTVNEALELVKKLNPKQTYFTHMSHHIGLHDEVNKQLPENVELAYDGLEIK